LVLGLSFLSAVSVPKVREYPYAYCEAQSQKLLKADTSHLTKNTAL
jgi:hypothetical protein